MWLLGLGLDLDSRLLEVEIHVECQVGRLVHWLLLLLLLCRVLLRTHVRSRYY